MNDLRTRVKRLEAHFGITPAEALDSPNEAEKDPELVAIWPDLQVIFEEHLKATGQTFTPDPTNEHDRHVFFRILGDALAPYPELKKKVGAIIQRQVERHQERRRQAGRKAISFLRGAPFPGIPP